MIRFLNGLLLLVVSFNMVACLNHNDDSAPIDSDTNNATYYMYHRTGFLQKTDLRNEFRIINTKKFNFQVCFNTHSTKNYLKFTEMDVFDGNIKKNIKASSTDDKGCYFWSESIKYDPLKQGKYIEIKRSFQPTKNVSAKGRVDVILPIYPWAGDAAGDSNLPVLHLGSDSSMETLKGVEALNYLEQPVSVDIFQQAKDGIAPKLFLPERLKLDIDETYQKKDGSWGINLTINALDINILKQSFDGQMSSFVPLGGGKARVTVWLFKDHPESTTKDMYITHLPPQYQTENILPNSTINIKREFKVKTKPNGKWQVAILITPISHNMMNLLPASGVYVIGAHRKLTTATSADLVSDLNTNFADFNISKYFQENLSNYEEYQKGLAMNQLPNQTYNDFETFIKFSGIKHDQDWTIERIVNLGIKVCLRHPITNEPVQREFLIYPIQHPYQTRKEPITKTSEGTWGCFWWQDNIWHSYYNREHIFKKTMIIEDKQTGVQQKIGALLNPWDAGWTFGRDMRWEDTPETNFSDSDNINPQSIVAAKGKLMEDKTLMKDYIANLKKSENLPSPEIRLETFTTRSNGIRYFFNDALEMKVHRKYRLGLWPTVERRDSFLHGRKPVAEHLRHGIWLVKMAVAMDKKSILENQPWLLKGKDRDYTQINPKDQVFSHWIGIVRSFNGRLFADIELPLDQVEMLSSRADLFVQIQAIDEKMLIQDGVLDQLISDKNLFNSHNDFFNFSRRYSGINNIKTKCDETDSDCTNVADVTESDGFFNARDLQWLSINTLEAFEKIEPYIITKEKPGRFKGNFDLISRVFHADFTLKQIHAHEEFIQKSPEGAEDNIVQLGNLNFHKLLKERLQQVDKGGFTQSPANELNPQQAIDLMTDQLNLDYIKLDSNHIDMEEISLQLGFKNKLQLNAALVKLDTPKKFKDYFMRKSPKQSSLISQLSENYDSLVKWSKLETLKHRLNIEDNSEFLQILAGKENDNEVVPLVNNKYTSEYDLWKFAKAMCMYYFSDSYAQDNVLGPSKKLGLFTNQTTLNNSKTYSNPREHIKSFANSSETEKPIHEICNEDPFSVINVKRHILVHETKQNELKIRRGFSENYNINSNFHFDYVRNAASYMGYNKSMNIGTKKGVGDVFGLFKNFPLNVLDFTIAYDGRYNSTYSENKMLNKGNGLSFTKGAYLVVHNTIFDIPLSKFQYCMTISPNPMGIASAINGYNQTLVKKLTGSNNWDSTEYLSRYIKGLEPNFKAKNLLKMGRYPFNKFWSEEEIRKYISKGMLVCSENRYEDLKGNDKLIQESYHFMFQHFTADSYTMDVEKRYLQPWLMNFRGKETYNMFIHNIERSNHVSTCTMPTEKEDLIRLKDEAKAALQRDRNLMIGNTLEYGVLPTMPRFYTVTNSVNRDFQPEYFAGDNYTFELEYMNWAKDLGFDITCHRNSNPNRSR